MSKRQEIIDVLATAPDGLITAQVCERVRLDWKKVAANLSRMYFHGMIDRVIDASYCGRGRRYIWRLKQVAS